MTAASGSTTELALTRGRASSGETSSFGERILTRLRYGSMRITVRPDVICQPAVPRYASWTADCAASEVANHTRATTGRSMESDYAIGGMPATSNCYDRLDANCGCNGGVRHVAAR